MKFVCKVTNSTLTFTVVPKGDTFGHLTSAVARFLDSSTLLYNSGSLPIPFDISLNGKDAVHADPDTLMTELGLVTGDILRIVVEKELLTCNASIEEATAKKEDKDMKTIMDRRKNQLMLCCESTIKSVPYSLMREYESSDVQTAHDAMIVVIHVLMSEVGFVKFSAEKQASLPQKGIYNLGYSHSACPKFVCKLVCTSMADKLVVHGLHVLGDENSKAVAKLTIHCSMFIRHRSDFNSSDLIDVYRSLKGLSENFKTIIVSPLLQALAECDTFVREGLMDLPNEIQMLIFEYLDVPDLLNVSAVCSHLHQLSNEQHLWKRLCLKNHCKNCSVSEDASKSHVEDWKQRYKEYYRNRGYKTISKPSRRLRWGPTMDLFRNIPSPPLPRLNILGGDFDRFPGIEPLYFRRNPYQSG